MQLRCVRRWGAVVAMLSSAVACGKMSEPPAASKSEPPAASKSEPPAPTCEEVTEQVGALILAGAKQAMVIRYGKEAAERIAKTAPANETVANAREAVYKDCSERPSIYSAEVRRCVLAARVGDDARACWERVLKKASDDAEAKSPGAPTCEQMADHMVEVASGGGSYASEIAASPEVRAFRDKMVAECKSKPWTKPPEMRRCVMTATDSASVGACETTHALK